MERVFEQICDLPYLNAVKQLELPLYLPSSRSSVTDPNYPRTVLWPPHGHLPSDKLTKCNQPPTKRKINTTIQTSRKDAILNSATAKVLSKILNWSLLSFFGLVLWSSCPQTAALLRAHNSAWDRVLGVGGLDIMREDRLFIIWAPEGTSRLSK